MSFAFPLAFLGLLSLPALVAIYWLRSRHKRRTVSSLMLWMDQRRTTEGGLIVDRLQTPLLFFLELLALLLITLAAAGPLLQAGRATNRLVIVLDNSFSMLAGGENSPKTYALRAVERELDSDAYAPIHLVLAGERPQLLGEAERESSAAELLRHWNCLSPSADLESAISFSFGVAGERGRVLVRTDHAPDLEIQESRLLWRGFGKPQSNVALINATRTHRDTEDRCFIEVANLSGSSVRTQLHIDRGPSDGSSETAPAPSDLEIAPHQTRRLVLTLPSGAPPLRVRLPEDGLAIDNQVTLLPRSGKPVRVRLEIADERLRALVEKAVTAGNSALVADGEADLAFTDERDPSTSTASTWLARIIANQAAESFTGPFVVNRNHPLSEGLSLEGVIWGAARSSEIAGVPVITAGNVPLLTDIARAGAHDLRLQFTAELSTLQETPNWPILFWNLIDWRAANQPGIREPNVRLESNVAAVATPGSSALIVRSPDGEQRDLPVTEGRVSVAADQPGIYEIKNASETYRFSVNPLRREESDLSSSSSGTWGDWSAVPPGELEQRSLSWLFLLAAMIVLS